MVAYLRIGPQRVANTFTEEGQEEVRATALANGNFVLVWRNEGGFGDTNDVVARVFKPDGTPVGSEIQVPANPAANQQNAYVVPLDGGGFIITWQDANNVDYADDTSGNAVRGAIFNDAGVQQGEQFLVNTTTSGAQQAATIAPVNGGGFFVTWQDASAAVEAGIGIRGQFFSSAGVKVGDEIRVNTTVTGDQTTPSVARLSNGNLVVVFADGSVSPADIRARIYDPAGNAVSATDFVIDTDTVAASAPFVTALSNGTFVVTWVANTDIQARVFDASGNPVTAEFTVSAPATSVGGQTNPTAVATPDGFIITWRDANTATDGSGIAMPAAMFDNFGKRQPWGTGNGQFFGDLLLSAEFINNQRVVIGGATALANGDLVFAFDDTSFLPPDTDDESIRYVTYRAYQDKYGTAGKDKLSGTSGRDFLVGFGGNDTLDGGKGDDVLEGGFGADKLVGGKGKDTASYSSAAAGLTASLAKSSTNTGDAAGDKYSSIENLLGSRFNDTLVGNGGKNVLDGGSGDDTLAGGGGADVLIGGAGIDTASYAAAKSAVKLSLEEGGKKGDAKGDKYFSIENVIGSKFGDTIEGDDGANAIDGGAGNDKLFGGGGNDTLIGGAGADVLNGGFNPDDDDDDEEEEEEDEDDGNDTASYQTSAKGVTVSLALAALGQKQVDPGTDAHGDLLISIENLTGSLFNDTLTGDDGDNVLSGLAGADTLIGGLGNDTLIGGAGADSLDGGDGNDTASYATATASVTANLATGGTAGDAAGDTYTSIENLVGSAFADTLTGDSGDNIIEGGLGNDTLDGGANGAGGDTVSYASATAAVTVNLATGTATGGAGTDTLSNFENIIGGAGADTLTGDAGNNVISGGAGNDTISGGDGADTLNGDAGNDSITGGNGNDVLNGGAGNDTLNGGNDNDTITGGAGADNLTGGSGADVFVYNSASEGGDTITDFNPTDDQFQISAAGFAGGLIAGNPLVNGTTFIHGAGAQVANSTSGTFLYNETTGLLSWDADGTGSGAAVTIATLTGAPTLTVTDFDIIV